MLLVLHKMTFHENEAAYLCGTMRKRASGIRAIICHIKFWHRYDIVENRFFWQELQVPKTWKRGPPPWAVTWREWNVQGICAGTVYMYIMSLCVTMTSILTWKVKWLRNPPSGNFLHVSPPFPHTFPHVSPSVSPVSLGISHVSPGVSPCFLF